MPDEPTDSERIDALETRMADLEGWLDALVPVWRGLVRRCGDAPVRDADGQVQPISYTIPTNQDPAAAEVPDRPTEES